MINNIYLSFKEMQDNQQGTKYVDLKLVMHFASHQVKQMNFKEVTKYTLNFNT